MRWLALTLVLVAMPMAVGAATRISSNSNCPSADAVSRQLLGLFVAAGPQDTSAHVRVEGETMRIELSIPGEVGHQRVLSLNGDCDQRAEIAALVIAAWLDAMPVGTISAPGVPPPSPSSAPAPQPPVVTTAGTEQDVERPPRVRRTLIGAGLFGMADTQGSSGGVALEIAMPHLFADIGWVAELSLAMPREMTVGQGTARYYRPTFTLAVTGDIRLTKWVVRPRGGVALGILAVNGSGYQTNRSTTTVTWGGGAGLTLVRPWHRGEIWIRFDGLVWPQDRRVKSRQVMSVGPDIEVALPGSEVRLAAGLSWGVH